MSRVRNLARLDRHLSFLGDIGRKEDMNDALGLRWMVGFFLVSIFMLLFCGGSFFPVVGWGYECHPTHTVKSIDDEFAVLIAIYMLKECVRGFCYWGFMEE